MAGNKFEKKTAGKRGPLGQKVAEELKVFATAQHPDEASGTIYYNDGVKAYFGEGRGGYTIFKEPNGNIQRVEDTNEATWGKFDKYMRLMDGPSNDDPMFPYDVGMMNLDDLIDWETTRNGLNVNDPSAIAQLKEDYPDLFAEARGPLGQKMAQQSLNVVDAGISTDNEDLQYAICKFSDGAIGYWAHTGGMGDGPMAVKLPNGKLYEWSAGGPSPEEVGKYEQMLEESYEYTNRELTQQELSEVKATLKV